MERFIRPSMVSPEETVKVCVIKASAQSGFKTYKKSMMGVPQNIFSLAACTPEWVQTQMIDETIDIPVDFDTDADIVVVMFSTPDAIRGYEIADIFREKGKTVVLGGLHVSFMKEEALEHGDSILVGECEGIWEELLLDWCDNQLKTQYERTSPVDLATLRPYPTDIIPTERYDFSWTISVSRGCQNKCSYCTVNKFFPTFRTRPIADIVAEIEQCETDFIELKADNMLCDRDYALELFRAIEPLNVIWFTALEPAFADDEELVRAAAKSGLRSVLLGIETPSRSALQDANKGHMKLEKLKKQIAFLHKFDIEIDSAMLFGFDNHDASIWEETLNFALEIGIDVSHGVVPIPFPGTTLYQRLESEGRLRTKDWSKYEGSYLVYDHPHFGENDMYEGILWYEEEFEKHKKKRKFKWKNRWGKEWSILPF